MIYAFSQSWFPQWSLSIDLSILDFSNSLTLNNPTGKKNTSIHLIFCRVCPFTLNGVHPSAEWLNHLGLALGPWAPASVWQHAVLPMASRTERTRGEPCVALQTTFGRPPKVDKRQRVVGTEGSLQFLGRRWCLHKGNCRTGQRFTTRWCPIVS